MNRFNQSTWSKVQCEMILAFLSFADYFRPNYFLLENVWNFVTFNKGQTFRLTLASLLEMGYQVIGLDLCFYIVKWNTLCWYICHYHDVHIFWTRLWLWIMKYQLILIYDILKTSRSTLSFVTPFVYIFSWVMTCIQTNTYWLLNIEIFFFMLVLKNKSYSIAPTSSL